jgi:hypothetical protein
MKQFYLSRLAFVFLLSASYAAFGQVYTTTLSGPNEQPPNASPGTGIATVTLVGTSMRLQTSFSGLIGTTSASHIHAPTPAPGTGTAGVATTTPTFPFFPLGVTAGTYDRTFDMTLASSYNPAFITANGGTPASAFAVLKAAMDAGRSYLNIHSSVFGGGEIRGFLIMCPTINVSIPDAFALPSGVLPNTVYPAYAPASSLTLQANASGGSGIYSYLWSNGATTASNTVSPVVTTAYTVSVLDQNRCPGTASKTVNVVDVSGGKKGDKINVCHKDRNTLTIGASGVADHIGHGDMLGNCADDNGSVTQRNIGTDHTAQLNGNLMIKALPNPSFNYFDIQVSGKEGSNMQMRVFDLLGRVVETRSSLQPNQTVRVGSFYKPGIYLVEIVQDDQKQTVRLFKGN